MRGRYRNHGMSFHVHKQLRTLAMSLLLYGLTVFIRSLHVSLGVTNSYTK
jgi:hypothetical protein